VSLGLGILLSALLIAFVTLFLVTRHEWNWRLILRRLTLVAIGAVPLALLVYYFLSRPESPHEYWNVVLEAPKADVRVIKGQPSEGGTTDVWIYYQRCAFVSCFPAQRDSANAFYQVGFVNGRVHYIQFSGPPGGGEHVLIRRRSGGYFLNLWAGCCFEPSLPTLLGAPTLVSTSSDGLTRLYSYDRYNIFVAVKENFVYALGIFDPAKGPFQLGPHP
jgi:hypothetical protein